MTAPQPDVGPPPRAVEPWTRVPGHVLNPGLAGGRAGRPLCSCGWTGPGDAPRDEQREHLRQAWPELLERLPDEKRLDWRARVALAHTEAQEEEERLWQAHRLYDGVRPGEPIPLVPAEVAAAGERVAVLEHQLQSIATEPF